MPDEIAPPAQGEAATPAAPVSGNEVTSGSDSATPQAGTPSAETPAGEKPNRAQERIEELVAQRNQAIQYGDFMRQRLDALTTQPKLPATEPAAEQPKPRPKRDDFDDPGAFAEALTDWSLSEADRRVRTAETEITKRATEASEQRLSKAREDERLKTLDGGWNERATTYAQANPDFWSKVQNPALSFLNGDFLEAVKGSDMGPQLVHHISNDAKLVAKLASQSVPQRLASLGRLEAELSRPAPPPKVTAAPAPPTPVVGSTASVDSAPKDVNDWMAWRNKQDPRLQRVTRR